MDLKYLDTLSNVTSLFLTAFVCSFYEPHTELTQEAEADSDSTKIGVNEANNLEGIEQQPDYQEHLHQYPNHPMQASHHPDHGQSYAALGEGQSSPAAYICLRPSEGSGNDLSGQYPTYKTDGIDLEDED